jgi:hypothetical protein
MVLVASLLLAAAFGWAALAKILRPGAWRAALAGNRLPAPVSKIASVGVPGGEITVAVLLALGGDRARAGAAAAVALLSAFSIAVLRARRLAGDRLPCGCFGGNGARDYRLMLVRNAALGLLAAVVLLAPEVELEVPERSEVVPAALVALGLTLIAWLVNALRGFRR